VRRRRPRVPRSGEQRRLEVQGAAQAPHELVVPDKRAKSFPVAWFVRSQDEAMSVNRCHADLAYFESMRLLDGFSKAKAALTGLGLP
jgi:hypothetical protein